MIFSNVLTLMLLGLLWIQNIIAKKDDMCPIQTFYVKHLKDPWISQEILEAIKDKDRLLSKAKRSDNGDNWIIARRRRNEVK